MVAADFRKVSNGEDPTRSIKKELDIIHDRQLNGKTVNITLADIADDHLAILNVRVIKTGDVT